jgi:predicted CoA-substrate-specific enzyme activase
MYSIGIDSGSSMTKGVLFDGEDIIKMMMLPTGANPRRTMQSVYESLKGDKDAYTVTTGYGRELLEERDKAVTEITCHGKGAAFLCKEATAIIDIGGQDSKVILLDRDKNIQDFIMNDKCAAGTGRFVEVIMRILHQDIDDLDQYVKVSKPVKISSMCTVFAESEVISLLAEDVPGSDIASGIVESICNRTAIFAKRLPLEEGVFFSGGLAGSKAICSALEKHVGLPIITHPLAQYTGAIGAAVIGYQKHRK